MKKLRKGDVVVIDYPHNRKVWDIGVIVEPYTHGLTDYKPDYSFYFVRTWDDPTSDGMPAEWLTKIGRF